jgi:peroxiredoxin (alkyl hydroperoxide reductase subunit C)
MINVGDQILDPEVEAFTKTTCGGTHKAWHESSAMVSDVRFPMLADPTGALCRAFGTVPGR